MKKFSWFKQSPCLFVFLFIGIISVISTCSLSAAVIEDFPPSDFWVVDHTTPEYTWYNGQCNPNGIIGYQPNPDNNNPNEYQLTDTITNMTVAMWNKHDLDLNRNWEFNFALFFDKGKFPYNQSIFTGSRSISDGMAFVLHKFDTTTTKYMIGGLGRELGYAPISPSFAVEFDTEWEDNNRPDITFDEGGNIPGCHISYLKDGNMAALPGTYKQMQYGWASVGVGDWFDVKIVWRKGYKANNEPYYDMLTYMREESNTHEGPLLLRDSMRFNRLSDVVDGLEVDSNCQALVTWGITSATCGIANHQMVRFSKLTTAELLVPTITAVISGRCESDHNMITTYALSDKKTVDTILHPKINASKCNSNDVLLEGDTIEYTISCEEFQCNNEYTLLFPNIPHGSVCKYYLNNELKDSIIYDTTVSREVWHELLYRYYFRNDSAANVKVIIDSVEYNFRIFSDDKTTDWADELSQEIDIQWDKGMRVGTIEVDSTSLAQSIQLPELAECSYELNPGSSDFATPPSIDSNGVLTFELKPDVCSTGFYIDLSCECDKSLYFTINNTTCPPSCDDVIFTEISRKTIPPRSLGHGMMLCSQLEINYLLNTTQTGSGITSVGVHEISATPGVSLKAGKLEQIGDMQYEFPVVFSGCVSDTIYKFYEVCTKFEGGTICCDTFEFFDYFNGGGILFDISPHPLGNLEKIAVVCNITPLVGPLPPGSVPVAIPPQVHMKITVYDFFGNQVAKLLDIWTTNINHNINYDVGHLPYGRYTVVLQIDDHIESKGFVKGGGQ